MQPNIPQEANDNEQLTKQNTSNTRYVNCIK